MKFYLYAYWHDARFKKEIGGPIKVFELSNNLIDLGHTVYLFIPQIGFPEKQTLANVVAVPFVDLPIVRFISYQIFSMILTLITVLRRGVPQIIYVRIMWSFLPMFFGKVFNIPVMLEINDNPYRGYAAIHNKLKRKIVHLIDKISYYFSDIFLPASDKIANDLVAYDAVQREKIKVLYSGTNSDIFRPIDKKVSCDKIGIDNNFKYVGFVGTFIKYQGIDTLIESALEIIPNVPQVKFILVGDGPMKMDWLSKIENTNLLKYFVFPGHVNYEEVPFFIGAMDICVAPFLKTVGESVAVKIFDYLACGKPVVMSNVNNTGKVYQSSGAVFLIPPEDSDGLTEAIIELLDNEKLRIDMGIKGRNYILKYFDRKSLVKQVEMIAFKLSNALR